jgi:hypothetical protein
MKKLLVLIALALPAAAPAQVRLPADSLARMRQYSEWFLRGQIDSLVAHVTPTARASITAELLTTRRGQFTQNAGVQIEVLEERFVWRGNARQYWRTMRTSTAPEPVLLRWVISPDGTLSGIGLNPQSATPPADSLGPVIKPD